MSEFGRIGTTQEAIMHASLLEQRKTNEALERIERLLIAAITPAPTPASTPAPAKRARDKAEQPEQQIKREGDDK